MEMGVLLPVELDDSQAGAATPRTTTLVRLHRLNWLQYHGSIFVEQRYDVAGMLTERCDVHDAMSVSRAAGPFSGQKLDA